MKFVGMVKYRTGESGMNDHNFLALTEEGSLYMLFVNPSTYHVSVTRLRTDIGWQYDNAYDYDTHELVRSVE